MNIVDLCKRYISLRTFHHYDELMALLSDSIVLTSQRDGIFRGKSKVLQYYKNTPPSGEWTSFEKIDNSTVVVRGIIWYVVFSINVKATFEFDSSNKIKTITVEKE